MRRAAELTDRNSVHQGYFRNREATFQQYSIVPADIVTKVRTFARPPIPSRPAAC